MLIKRIKNKSVDNFNDLTYSEALRLDRRNFFRIFMLVLKMKIEIISILCNREEFTHISLTLSVYLLNFLFSFFMNAFLYTDDIISEKYHNNGQLNLLTTLFLSLTSNIVSSILIFYIKKLIEYKDYLIIMVNEVSKQNAYVMAFQKLYKILLIKVFIYIIISILLTIIMTLYLLIFCQIYQRSQNSLIINYLMSLIESIVYSIVVAFVVCSLRLIGLKCKSMYTFRISVYLDNKF